ncbi:histone-lysine N-methyltransferase ATX2-like protein isoform X1 [Tanacetum coccineum]
MASGSTVNEDVPVFIDTNLGTHFAFTVSPNLKLSNFKNVFGHRHWHRLTRLLYRLQMCLVLILVCMHFGLLRIETSSSTESAIWDAPLNSMWHLLLNGVCSGDDVAACRAGLLERVHLKCFPGIGNIEVDGLMVKRKSRLYHLTESMLIKHAFRGSKGTWFLYTEAHPSTKIIPSTPQFKEANKNVGPLPKPTSERSSESISVSGVIKKYFIVSDDDEVTSTNSKPLGLKYAPKTPPTMSTMSHVRASRDKKKSSGVGKRVIVAANNLGISASDKKPVVSLCKYKCAKLSMLKTSSIVMRFGQKLYLNRQNLPKSMLQLRNGVGADLEGDGKKDEGSGGSKKTCLSTELVETKFKGTKSGPFIVGDLEVLKLGKMVKDLNCVNDDGSIWPLSYTATRKFPSLSDPSVCSVYKMEVLWDTGTQTQPLFRVATNNGGQMHSSIYDNSQAEAASESLFKSGADMFGFSDAHVLRLIQVHARCYGELEPVDGVLWLCNLCRPGAPEVSPPCCLCPVTVLAHVTLKNWGGAMKPTTDGRWAHLACAMWIPGPLEAFLASVVFLMELVSRHSPNRSTERVAPDERIGQLPSQVLRASEGSVDAPGDQNLRPTGRMRGSLMGCVYSNALSQKIILPTEPVQPASQPVLNTPRPALAPHLQVLSARNGNIHGYLDGASGMFSSGEGTSNHNMEDLLSCNSQNSGEDVHVGGYNTRGTTSALHSTSQTVKTNIPRKQLTQQEIEDEDCVLTEQGVASVTGSEEETMPQISLNAMTGVNNYQTMRAGGHVGKQLLHILVDCGSTHNFLDLNAPKRLGCTMRKICPLKVYVANGQVMSICMNAKISSGNCKVKFM